jgi:hypothetical protein
MAANSSGAATDRHGTLSMDELLDLGCSCEFGCSQCNEPLSRMGNCPGWNACPIGRCPDPDCRLSKRRVRMDLEDGGYMDVTVAADASPETMAALRSLGEAALAHMKEADDGA